MKKKKKKNKHSSDHRCIALASTKFAPRESVFSEFRDIVAPSPLLSWLI